MGETLYMTLLDAGWITCRYTGWTVAGETNDTGTQTSKLCVWIWIQSLTALMQGSLDAPQSSPFLEVLETGQGAGGGRLRVGGGV